MPAKSKRQLKYIYAMRNKYGNKKNAPKNMKWVFNDEWIHLKEKMTYLKNINDFISEKLGINDNIVKYADLIIDKLKETDFYLLKTNYKGKDIEVQCYLRSKIHGTNINSEIAGSFLQIDDNIYAIELSKLDRNILIHELKHLDYSISRNKLNQHHYISHVGRNVINNYNHLVNKDFSDALIDILYYINPNEFESYYNEFYHELKQTLTDDMTIEEKRKYIDDFLNSHSIYFCYKYYKDGNFDIEQFFTNKKDLNLFIDKLIQKIQLENPYEVSKKDILLNRMIKILSIFKVNKLSDENRKVVTLINNLINREIKRNYKKFSRLYTLLLT